VTGKAVDEKGPSQREHHLDGDDPDEQQDGVAERLRERGVADIVL